MINRYSLRFFLISICFLYQCSINDSPNKSEIPEGRFVWKICNDNEIYTMENLTIMDDSLSLGNLSPGKCTQYYKGINQGNNPLNWVQYKQNNEIFDFIYLESLLVTRGLIDSINIYNSPGRYSYHFLYDSSLSYKAWVEIEREAYH